MSVDIGAADGGPALARPGRGDAVQIVDLDPSHLAEAARLYAAEFRRLRGASRPCRRVSPAPGRGDALPASHLGGAGRGGDP